MPTMYRSTLASLFVVLLAVALLVPVTPATAAESAVGRGIQVWNLNTHKMHRGDTDYTKFLDYVTDTSNPGVDHWPDILTLQEVQSEKSKPCSSFVKALERRTGRHDYGCVKTKTQGGAAIVYRKGKNGLRRVGDKREVRLRINKEKDDKGCVPTSGTATARWCSASRSSRAEPRSTLPRSISRSTTTVTRSTARGRTAGS